MSARTLGEMLKTLTAVVEADPTRSRRASQCRTSAGRVARQMPLVRRIAGPVRGSRPVAQTWMGAIDEHALEPVGPATDIEAAIGVPPSVYFFLGAAAYPAGDIAILCVSRVTEARSSSFWPFDTGAIAKEYVRPSGAGSWSASDREACLATYWGSGNDLVDFATEYLAAHFAEPLDYVRAPQQSNPNDPPYHGLVSTSGDRRAWTLEVQVHARVSLAAPQGFLHAIVLKRHHLLADLPDDLAQNAIVDPDLCDRVRRVVEIFCTEEAA